MCKDCKNSSRWLIEVEEIKLGEYLITGGVVCGTCNKQVTNKNKELLFDTLKQTYEKINKTK